MLVQRIQLLARGAGHVQVQALCLVDPLLAPAGGFDQPARIEVERRRVQGFHLGRYALDRAEVAVEVLQVGQHHLVPQSQTLQVADQVLVDHGELAGQVRFDEQVLVRRFDTGRHADDVGDGRGRGDGQAVRVAHAELLDAGPQAVPVQRGRAVDFQPAAARLGQQVEAVVRQDAAAPQAAVVGLVGAAFLGQ